MPQPVAEATALRDRLKVRDFAPRAYEDQHLLGYQMAVADIFAASPDIDPQVVPAYHSFLVQLSAQWCAMIEAGIDVEFHDWDPDAEEGAPDSAKMFARYRETGTLHIFRSEDGYHPLMDRLKVHYKGRTENGNSVFRAVHDFLGHLATGASFGWRGETRAYYSHGSTFTEDALPALFSETVGQQSWWAVYHDYSPQKSVYYGPEWHYPPLA